MHLSIDISPVAGAKITAFARTTGQDISTVIEGLIEQIPSKNTPYSEPDEENAAAIALLKAWTEEDERDASFAVRAGG